jgi:asparagine synthase (glutamine-hydrolysing)
VAKLSKDYVKVVLSGEGSDELFGGYWETGWALKGIRRRRFYANLPRSIRKRLLDKIAFILYDHQKVERFLNRVEEPESLFSLLILEEPLVRDVRNQLYIGELRDSIDKDPHLVARDYLLKSDADDYVDQQLYVDFKSWLPDDLLVKADKMTMAHSVELRVPFLDHRIVEFAASLPRDMRVRESLFGNCVTKPILREIMRGRLPNGILRRKKWGFLNPKLPWMADGLLHFGRD